MSNLICRDTDCETCGVRAEHRTCADCGVEGIVTDCGHKAQPRPIAAAGDHTGDAVCETCWRLRSFGDAGVIEGRRDAETWISEERPHEDALRRCAAPGTVLPDESLINALGDVGLAKEIGVRRVRDEDGDWTPAARAWLLGYNHGYRARVEEEIQAPAEPEAE